MDRATLRSKLMQRVEKHQGHWHWMGMIANEVPVFRVGHNGPRLFARRVVYELHIGELVGRQRVVATCDEETCIAPQCLALDGCSKKGHTGRFPDGACRECAQSTRKRKVSCTDCGRVVQRSSLGNHRTRWCKGPQEVRKTQHHRSAEERAQLAHDVAADLAAGLTPEGICDAYDTTPGGMDAALRRLGRPELARPFQRLEYHQRQAQAQDS